MSSCTPGGRSGCHDPWPCHLSPRKLWAFLHCCLHYVMFYKCMLFSSYRLFISPSCLGVLPRHKQSLLPKEIIRWTSNSPKSLLIRLSFATNQGAGRFHIPIAQIRSQPEKLEQLTQLLKNEVRLEPGGLLHPLGPSLGTEMMLGLPYAAPLSPQKMSSLYLAVFSICPRFPLLHFKDTMRTCCFLGE